LIGLEAKLIPSITWTTSPLDLSIW